MKFSTWLLSHFFLILPLYVDSVSLKRSKARSDFEKICPKGQTVNGLLAFPYKNKVRDIRLMVVCKPIDHNGKFKTGKCRNADEFQLFSKNGRLGTNLVGSSSNCAQGEYLAGIRSSYNRGIRMLQFHCCSAKNVQIDQKIGCHHVHPEDPFMRSSKDGLFLIMNSIYHTSKCPRDALSAVEVSPSGIGLKFCPYKIDGKNYSPQCFKTKKSMGRFTECDGISKRSESKCSAGGWRGNGNGKGNGKNNGNGNGRNGKNNGKGNGNNNGKGKGSEGDFTDGEDFGDGFCSNPKIQKKMVLIGHVQEVADALSLAQCVRLCSDAESKFGFSCLSAMFYPSDPDQNCLLNSENASANPHFFVEEDEGMDMFFFEC